MTHSDQKLLLKELSVALNKSNWLELLHDLMARGLLLNPEPRYQNPYYKTIGKTPLDIALEEGHDGAFEKMIEMGADINHKHSHGEQTLLSSLIDNPSSIYAKHTMGFPYFFIKNYWDDVIEYLLDKGMILSSKDTARLVDAVSRQPYSNNKINIQKIIKYRHLISDSNLIDGTVKYLQNIGGHVRVNGLRNFNHLGVDIEEFDKKHSMLSTALNHQEWLFGHLDDCFDKPTNTIRSVFNLIRDGANLNVASESSIFWFGKMNPIDISFEYVSECLRLEDDEGGLQKLTASLVIFEMLTRLGAKTADGQHVYMNDVPNLQAALINDDIRAFNNIIISFKREFFKIFGDCYGEDLKHTRELLNNYHKERRRFNRSLIGLDVYAFNFNLLEGEENWIGKPPLKEYSYEHFRRMAEQFISEQNSILSLTQQAELLMAGDYSNWKPTVRSVISFVDESELWRQDNPYSLQSMVGTALENRDFKRFEEIMIYYAQNNKDINKLSPTELNERLDDISYHIQQLALEYHTPTKQQSLLLIAKQTNSVRSAQQNQSLIP